MQTTNDWPPDYTAVFQGKQKRLAKLRENPLGAKEYYRTRPVEFIEHWVNTYDPRNAGGDTPASMPFMLFDRQKDLIEFLLACLEGEESGLIEKCRDMGASWVCCAFSVWLWIYWDGSSVGWGSRKEQLVDKIGDPDSIFEKMRMIIGGLPKELQPRGFTPKVHATFMKIINPENGSTITGEGGDNIGRGGRKLIYFKDEAAHFERPEKIEAALADTTRVQIDISSVNGIGNVFYRRREAGEEWFGGPVIAAKTNVLVMDWRDHPAKDQAWYDKRKAKALDDGLMHIFAQEVDRNYSASVEGVIIPSEWVSAAIDAHIKLKFANSGRDFAGLDVADDGGDKNALALRKGPVLRSVSDWADGDTGFTTRKAVAAALPGMHVQYDSVGVGAGVKAEANRLSGINKLPKRCKFIPWSAGAGPLDPTEHINPKDEDTPLNRDFYANLKAQGWWQLRIRFEKTYRAVTEGIEYPQDELISLPSSLKKLSQLQKELSQATASQTTSNLKLQVNKKPKGTRSPNLADAVVMAFWPVNTTTYDWDGAI